MKRLDEFTVRELSKIINQSNLMPTGDNTSFLKLSEHLIKRLQNDVDLEKINRIVSSELISTFGLDVSEKQGRKLSEDIYDWYHN